MKYIKEYNHYLGYQQITATEHWRERLEHGISMQDVNINKLLRLKSDGGWIIKPDIIQKNEYLAGSEVSANTPRKFVEMSIAIINSNGKIGGWDELSIHECNDEWFLVGFNGLMLADEITNTRGIKTIGGEYYYKCDQMDGLLNLIKDKYDINLDSK